MRKFSLLPLFLSLSTSAALAQQTDELNALHLADSAPKPVASTSDWHAFTELAFGQAMPRMGGTGVSSQRLSFEFEFDQTFAPGWRAVLADRLDLNRQDQTLSLPAAQPEVNTLKEAYLSWQIRPDQLLDLGRINAYQGVASGYNPTDFFRTGAVRSKVSVDPASLKKNRLGSVMLRGQHLWESGSLSALYSPQLERQANASSFSPDLGATNNQERWLFALSQQIGAGITPQWLIYGKAQQQPQLGFNLSALANDATVVYLEWSGGRSRSQLAQALGDEQHGEDDTALRQRLATGLTYTSSAKLSLTLEYEYNGAALNKSGWDALRQGSPLAYGRYRAWQQTAQELPTREEIFFYANWQDAGLLHLDLSAMQKINLADHSRLSWLEARYRLDKADLALQWQKNSGHANSAYGAAFQKRSWQVLLRYYF